ncbi:hypothetical protein BDZ91DRAFT_788982 [Kalaharituber pfeilii]|nr:hypothetical protein BDZ91DRAFT_788982 [Kalaharituber pfeilii]
MVTRRKRATAAQDEGPPAQLETSTKKLEIPIRQQVRNCWEFAALGQYLYIFGSSLKIPDTWSIEVLEDELLGQIPEHYIPQIKIALLRNVSSHKGVVDDQFDDYTRRQYLTKKPSANPFGDEEHPVSFADLPVLTKVLHQLSLWTLIHPEKLREKLDEATDKAQLEWRIEPCGYDSKENVYFLLDDDRLYQRTEMKIPSTTRPAKPKMKTTSRPSKRRRLANGHSKDAEDEQEEEDPEKVMLESMEWRCVCATIEDYQKLIDQWKKSKDINEKNLRTYLIEDVLPALYAAEEEKRKEEAERQRKLALEAAVANRKRSSRIDAKLARQREIEQKAEEERKRQEELRAAREAAERLERIGRERESRLAARERRIREREERLLRSQQSSNKDSADDSDNTSRARMSTRRLELEAKKLEEEKERFASEWVFDCICGVHGINFDDGSPQVACDKCEIWQHVACLKLPPGSENKEFICDRCQRRATASSLGAGQPQSLSPISPRITIKLKVPQAQHHDVPQIRLKLNVPTEKPKTTNILPLSPRSSSEQQAENKPNTLLPPTHSSSSTNPPQSSSPSPPPPSPPPPPPQTDLDSHVANSSNDIPAPGTTEKPPSPLSNGDQPKPIAGHTPSQPASHSSQPDSTVHGKAEGKQKESSITGPSTRASNIDSSGKSNNLSLDTLNHKQTNTPGSDSLVTSVGA